MKDIPVRPDAMTGPIFPIKIKSGGIGDRLLIIYLHKRRYNRVQWLFKPHSNTSILIAVAAIPIVAVDYCRQLVTVDYCHRFPSLPYHSIIIQSASSILHTTFIRRRYSRRYRPNRPIANRGSLISLVSARKLILERELHRPRPTVVTYNLIQPPQKLPKREKLYLVCLTC